MLLRLLAGLLLFFSCLFLFSLIEKDGSNLPPAFSPFIKRLADWQELLSGIIGAFSAGLAAYLTIRATRKAARDEVISAQLSRKLDDLKNEEANIRRLLEPARYIMQQLDKIIPLSRPVIEEMRAWLKEVKSKSAFLEMAINEDLPIHIDKRSKWNQDGGVYRDLRERRKTKITEPYAKIKDEVDALYQTLSGPNEQISQFTTGIDLPASVHLQFQKIRRHLSDAVRGYPLTLDQQYSHEHFDRLVSFRDDIGSFVDSLNQMHEKVANEKAIIDKWYSEHGEIKRIVS